MEWIKGQSPFYVLFRAALPLRQLERPGGSTTPRTRRFAPCGYQYHVVNRGCERRRIFHEDEDYERFLRLLARAKEHCPVKLYGLCLIGNHVHAVLEPEEEGALSAYLKRVLGGYACYLRQRTGTMGYGHVFQSRYWSDGIEDSKHFFTVLRYVEANPVRARLVQRAEHWQWSSLSIRLRGIRGLLDEAPYTLPDDWVELVNDPQSIDEIERLQCRPIGRPRQAPRPGYKNP